MRRQNAFRFARRDGNHDELARLFASVPGCQVFDTSAVGGHSIPGFQDLEIAWRGRLIPVEIKAVGGTLTEAERQHHARLAGCGVLVEIVREVADVYRVLGLVDPRGTRGA